jgi:flavin-dependent dehydrogenase
MRSWDVAVAGGGLAGAAAACQLASAGRRVVLLEREPGPRHKVCGEFISVEAQQQLATLGRAPAGDVLAALGAVPIELVRLASGAAQATAPLPFLAYGLSRLRLDAWLLAQAERAGASVERGRSVLGIDADRAGVRVRTAEGELAAGAAVLAIGKHELRGHRRRGPACALIGLKLHLRLSREQDRALQRHVELVLFPGGYAGLQPVEHGLANLCLLVDKERYASLGRDWRALVAAVPHLRQRLDGAVPCWERPLAVYRVPYGYLHRDDGEARLYRVGDQFAVIPSFTGDGMAMALHGAGLAAAAILAGRSAAAFHDEARQLFRPSLRVAGLVAAAGAVPWLQGPLTAACRLAPGLVTVIARRTRIGAMAALPEGSRAIAPCAGPS